MGMTKKEFLGCSDPIECFITQSDFRIPTNKDNTPAWLDAGDTLSINTNNDTGKINSVAISRGEGKCKETLTFTFDDESKSEVNQISDHLLFLAKSGLKLEDFPEISYRIEVVVQCHCGNSANSIKKKISYYFYEENERGETCIHAGGGGSAGGGGWNK